MRHSILQLGKQLSIICCITLFVSCGNKEKFNFKSPEEAITACESEYSDLKEIKEVNIKQLTQIANNWIALQDSTIKVIAKSDTITTEHPMFNYFFTLSDSIRTQISKLAYLENRSVEDVIYLKLNTVYGMEETSSSREFKNAVKFYKEQDNAKLYPSAEKSVSAYIDLLKNADAVKKEQDLMDFMIKEDMCYRSLLKYQAKIEPEQMEEIAEASERFFNNLQYAMEQKENDVNKRLLAYLNVRINRRIVQSAESCIEDINNKVDLSIETRNSYRWSILQPYLSIDKYMAAYLTPEQKKTLTEIGKNLPEYLSYLDSYHRQMTKKEKEKLSELLANSLLSMYLKQSL